MTKKEFKKQSIAKKFEFIFEELRSLKWMAIEAKLRHHQQRLREFQQGKW